MAKFNNNKPPRGKTATSFRRNKVSNVKSGKKFKQSRKLVKKAVRAVSDATFSRSYLEGSLISTPIQPHKKNKKRKGGAVRNKRIHNQSTASSSSMADSLILSGNVGSENDSIVSNSSDLSYKFRNDYLGGRGMCPPGTESTSGQSGNKTIIIEDDDKEKTVTPEEVGNFMLEMIQPNIDSVAKGGRNQAKTKTNDIAKEAINKTIVLDDTQDTDDDVIIVDDDNFPPLSKPSSSRQKPLTPATLQEITTRYPSTAPDFIPLFGKNLANSRRRTLRNSITNYRGKHPVKRLQPRQGPRVPARAGTISKSAQPTSHHIPHASRNVISSGPTIFSSASSSNSSKVSGSLRPIVIDGSNVAMSHGNNKVFSVKGIEIVVRYFEGRGHHKIVAFVPQFRDKPSQTNDRSLLNKLIDEGRVILTPSREVDNQRINSYDDTFVLDYAALHGGVVVTRDNYRDLINEKKEWREVVEKRILMQTFVGDDVIFPHDPLGRTGPTLDDFLKF